MQHESCTGIVCERSFVFFVLFVEFGRFGSLLLLLCLFVWFSFVFSVDMIADCDLRSVLMK